MPLPDDSLVLWLTLANDSWESKALLTDLALRQMEDPGVDPHFTFEDKPLLLLACKRCPILSDKDALDSSGLPAVLRPVTRLLEQGADPWVPVWVDRQDPSNQVNVFPRLGMSPFLELLRAQAWPVIDLFLKHPSRPSWETLFTETIHGEPRLLNALDGYPQTLPLFLEHGLDPNLRIGGEPLVFKVRKPDTARQLVAAGADPSALSDDGVSLLAHKESRAIARHQPLSGEERTAWAQLMGHAHVQPDEIFRAAMSGSLARLKPLFAQTRDMKAWSWEPAPGVHLNVLDGALHGQFHLASTSNSVVGLFAKSKSVPVTPAQADMVWMHSQLGTKPDLHDPAVGSRMIRALDALLNLDRQVLELDSIVTRRDAHCTPIHTLFQVCLADPSHPHVEPLLDRWLAWYAADPLRWKQSSSLATGPSPFPIEQAAPRHQVALWGHRLLSGLTQHSSAVIGDRAEQAAVAKGAVQDAFQRLMRAHNEAGDSFPEAIWEALWDQVGPNMHLGATLIDQRLAWVRSQHAADQAPAPRRSRVRA